MVDLTHAGPSVQPQEEVDLTDEEIQQLLLEAEGRLRGPVVSTTQDFDAASLRYVKPPFNFRLCHGSHSSRIPKLSSGTVLEPYVRQGDEIATVDSAQLIDPKQKELSNSIRSLDAKNPKKVSFFLSSLFSPSLFAMRKIFPNA
jgi:hypothetical protein